MTNSDFKVMKRQETRCFIKFQTEWDLVSSKLKDELNYESQDEWWLKFFFKDTSSGERVNGLMHSTMAWI